MGKTTKTSNPRKQNVTQDFVLKKESISQKAESPQIEEKRKRKKKEVPLIFPGINYSKILLKYDFIEYQEEESGLPETRINFDDDFTSDDLKKKKDTRHFLFLDTYHKPIKSWVGMFDKKNNDVLPRYTDIRCWSCHSSFKTHPLGCPLEHKTRKNTVASVFNDCLQKFVENGIEQEIIEKFGFFETEGIVCSFPCMKNYLLESYEKTKSSKYRSGLSLMNVMMKFLYEKIIEIQRSKGYKVTKPYGGHLTPEELRASYGILDYTETPNFNRLVMSPVFQCVQEKEL